MRYRNNRRRRKRLLNENFSGADMPTVEDHLGNTYHREIGEKIIGELRSSVYVDRVDRNMRNGVYILEFTGTTGSDFEFDAMIQIYDMFRQRNTCEISATYETPFGENNRVEDWTTTESPVDAMNQILNFFKLGLGARR